jgi:Na+/proline symporter
VIKLVALLSVGVFVVWGVADGPADVLARIDAQALPEWQIQPGRWTGLILLSAIAILTLPRMFQVLVVENINDEHLATASWAFPVYLFAISLFVLPIATVGMQLMPEGSNPDMFVMTLPLALGRDDLALLAFLGGFSAATSMVIVACLALATMVSNHIVVPLWLRMRAAGSQDTGDMRRLVLNVRRLSITLVLGFGYLYYVLSGGSEALAAIGLIAFVGVAQILPALLGALFWRGASRTGAALGLLAGAALWGYTLLAPSFGPGVIVPAGVMENGLFGLSWLRPYSLFGLTTLDPLLHALFWSWLVTCSCSASRLSSVFPARSNGCKGRCSSMSSTAQGRRAAGRGRWPLPRTCCRWRSAYWAQRRRRHSFAHRRPSRARPAFCPISRPNSSKRWNSSSPGPSGRQRHMP